MNRPSQAQLQIAVRLLAHEAAVSNAEGASTAAARVYDKFNATLAPLVGTAGVHALLGRSAKLAAVVEVPGLVEVSVFDGSSKLRDWFETQDPEVVAASAAAVFGTFLDLLVTLIGERLTKQLLRRAWPTVEELAPSET